MVCCVYKLFFFYIKFSWKNRHGSVNVSYSYTENCVCFKKRTFWISFRGDSCVYFIVFTQFHPIALCITKRNKRQQNKTVFLFQQMKVFTLHNYYRSTNFQSRTPTINIIQTNKINTWGCNINLHLSVTALHCSGRNVKNKYCHNRPPLFLRLKKKPFCIGKSL